MDPDYLPLLKENLPKPLSPRRLRKGALQPSSPLQNYEEEPIRNKRGRGVTQRKLAPQKKRWSNATLKAAIQTLDNGHRMKLVCQKFGIPRSSFREHYLEKRKSRKVRVAAVLTMAEEAELVQYMEDMIKISCPLNTIQLR